MLSAHRPVWNWVGRRLVCAADGREACPCYRHAVDLITHECPGNTCWSP